MATNIDRPHKGKATHARIIHALTVGATDTQLPATQCLNKTKAERLKIKIDGRGSPSPLLLILMYNDLASIPGSVSRKTSFND